MDLASRPGWSEGVRSNIRDRSSFPTWDDSKAILRERDCFGFIFASISLASLDESCVVAANGASVIPSQPVIRYVQVRKLGGENLHRNIYPATKQRPEDVEYHAG